MLYHLRMSTKLVHVLEFLQVRSEDMVVSFNIVSLFARVLIRDTLNLLGQHFEESILTHSVMSEPFYNSASMDNSRSRQMEWLWYHCFLP